MLRRFRSIVAVASFFALTSCLPTIRVPSDPVSVSAPKEGLSAVSQPGWFRALMPGTPKEESVVIKGPDGAPSTMKLVSATSPDGLWVGVFYFEAPYGFTDPPDTVLSSAWTANGPDVTEAGPVVRIPEPTRAERSGAVRVAPHTTLNPSAAPMAGQMRAVVTFTKVIFTLVIRDESRPAPPDLERIVQSIEITAK